MLDVEPEFNIKPAHVKAFVRVNEPKIGDDVESKSNSYLPILTPDDFNASNKPAPTTKFPEL